MNEKPRIFTKKDVEPEKVISAGEIGAVCDYLLFCAQIFKEIGRRDDNIYTDDFDEQISDIFATIDSLKWLLGHVETTNYETPEDKKAE